MWYAGRVSRTELARFKILNRLTKYNLKIISGEHWVKAGVNTDNYSFIKFFDEKHVGLHIVSALLFIGMESDSDLSLHKCDIKGCCNPSHLYVGKDWDNAKDRTYRAKNKIDKGIVINRPMNQEDRTMPFMQ